MAAPDLVNAKRAALKGSVKIVDWRDNEHSPSEIGPIVKRHGPIDLVILDYLQLMVPDRTQNLNRWERRHLYSKLGRDIRDIAKQVEAPVLTAWQTNRKGAEADTVTEFDVAECWDIVQHADVLLGISTSPNERKLRRLHIHPLLQRYSQATGNVEYIEDFERNQLREVPPHVNTNTVVAA
jgi:hypothetical protein